MIDEDIRIAFDRVVVSKVVAIEDATLITMQKVLDGEAIVPFIYTHFQSCKRVSADRQKALSVALTRYTADYLDADITTEIGALNPSREEYFSYALQLLSGAISQYEKVIVPAQFEVSEPTVTAADYPMENVLAICRTCQGYEQAQYLRGDKQAYEQAKLHICNPHDDPNCHGKVTFTKFIR